VAVSFLVRLVPGALAESRIVGQVVEVRTGASAQLHDAADLIAFLLSHWESGSPAQARPEGQ